MHTVFHRDKTKDAHPESCCSPEKGGQPLPWFEHRKNVPQFAEPIEPSFGPDCGKGAKSLVELLVSKDILLIAHEVEVGGTVFENLKLGVGEPFKKLRSVFHYLGSSILLFHVWFMQLF